MKDRKGLKQAAALSLAIITLSFLICCGEDIKETTDNKNTNSTEVLHEIFDETVDFKSERTNLPAKDYGGDYFTFLVTDTGYFGTHDIFVENITGEPINDAVYQRNSIVEDRYNIIITEIRSDTVVADATKMVMSGDNTSQAIFGPRNLTSLAESGGLLDLLTLPYIETEKEWWDINIFKEFTLNNKAYFGTGDISIMDDDCTLLITFNKWLIENNNLSDPYELVATDSWTIDKMAEMCHAVTTDLNGDGNWDEEDRYGLSYAYDHINYYWRAFGNRFSYIKGGKTSIFELSEKSVNGFMSIYDFLRNQNVCYAIPDIINTSSDPSYRYTLSRKYFVEDKYLFVLSEPLIFYEFRDMKNDFGILPFPKFDEAQERYYTPLDVASTFLCVPTIIPDTELVGLILEEMARTSRDIIKPAYYEITLKNKYSRDLDSERMLDLVFSTRTYDIAVIYNWGLINNIMTELVLTQSTDLASAYEKRIESIKAQMENTIINIID